MTVSTTTRYNEAAAGATVYYFTFRCDDTSWLRVYVGGVLVGTAYTAALNADQSTSPGGTVTFPAAATDVVRIERVTPLTQATAYAAYDAFPAETHELALDKVTLALQDSAAQEAALRAAGDAAEAALRAAADAAIIASGAQPANVGLALVTATGSTEARTVATRFSDRPSVLDFGADPTGAADSTAAFTAASAACVAAGGGDILIPAGDFKIGDLAWQSGVRWVGKGRGRTVLTRLNAGDSYILRAQGTVGSTSNLSSNAAAGAFSVAVANGALWAVGDWALIRESTYVATTVGRKQQVLRVVDVTGNTVTFAEPLFEAYTTAATAQLCVYTPIQDIGLYDLSMVGVNAVGGGGVVQVIRAANVEIDGVSAQYAHEPGLFYLETSRDVLLHNVIGKDGVQVGTAGKGYGLDVNEACAFVRVEDSLFENVRECTFTNRTTWSKFIRNRCVGSEDSGFNTHGSFVTHIDIHDNQVIGVKNGSGLIVGYSTHNAGDQDISIKRNMVKFPATASYGIIASAPTGKENKRIEISGNRVLLSGSNYGIAAAYSNQVDIRDNHIDFQGLAGNSGLYLVVVTEGTVAGNRVRNGTGTYGVRMDSCVDVDLLDNGCDALDASSNYKFEGTNTRCFVRTARQDKYGVAGTLPGYSGRVQRGTATTTGFSAGASTVDVAVTFPSAYPTGVVPVVVCETKDSTFPLITQIKTVSATGFTVRVCDAGGTSRTIASQDIYWKAVE
jgi:hypothetical protein